MSQTTGSPLPYEQGQQDPNATSGAQDKARQVAGQAQGQAQQAAGQAKGRLRDQVDQRSTQVGGQVSSSAQDARDIAQQLRDQGKDQPAKLADQAADRAQRLGQYLEQSDADTILGDVEDFARRQPWAVLGGGLALGFAASRFLKASSAKRYEHYQSTGGQRSRGYDRSRTYATGSSQPLNAAGTRVDRVERTGLPSAAEPVVPVVPADPRRDVEGDPRLGGQRGGERRGESSR